VARRDRACGEIRDSKDVDRAIAFVIGAGENRAIPMGDEARLESRRRRRSLCHERCSGAWTPAGRSFRAEH
ncbi:MAG TPA: hypothetical protein VGF91_27335, partial [Solirubrobacteraceae bacterium]